MDRVTTQHTRVHVKGAGVRIEGGTGSAENVVMGTLPCGNLLMQFHRCQKGSVKGFGNWFRAQRATGPCVCGVGRAGEVEWG